MAASGSAYQTESRHQNVNGLPIVLSKRRIGDSVCMEYTVRKERSQMPYILFVCIGFLFLSMHCNSVLGTSFFTVLFVMLFYIVFWDIEKEILLVTVPVGLQFTSFFKSGQQTTCFIPWHCVKDVYIVEAISLHRVLYNLVVCTESEEKNAELKTPSQKLVPLFQGTKPRLSCLESIYQGIYSLLPKKDKTTLKV